MLTGAKRRGGIKALASEAILDAWLTRSMLDGGRQPPQRSASAAPGADPLPRGELPPEGRRRRSVNQRKPV